MKYLNTGVSNTFYATVAEKQTLTSPYWLLRFVKDGTNEEYAGIVTDTASYPNRVNKFTVDLSAGNFTGMKKGIYTYYIYEQSSNTNTDHTLATTLCEIGQAEVLSASVQVASYPTYTIERPWTTQ